MRMIGSTYWCGKDECPKDSATSFWELPKTNKRWECFIELYVHFLFTGSRADRSLAVHIKGFLVTNQRGNENAAATPAAAEG